MTKPVLVAFLAVATIAAVALLLPDPIGSGSAAAWVRATLPLILAGGMAQYAYRADQRAEHSTANALLLWAGIAAGVVALIASLGG